MERGKIAEESEQLTDGYIDAALTCWDATSLPLSERAGQWIESVEPLVNCNQ